MEEIFTRLVLWLHFAALILPWLLAPIDPAKWSRYRAWRGGHWEKWHVGGKVNEEVWFQTDGCYCETACLPAGACLGEPECEDW